MGEKGGWAASEVEFFYRVGVREHGGEGGGGLCGVGMGEGCKTVVGEFCNRGEKLVREKATETRGDGAETVGGADLRARGASEGDDAE